MLRAPSTPLTQGVGKMPAPGLKIGGRRIDAAREMIQAPDRERRSPLRDARPDRPRGAREPPIGARHRPCRIHRPVDDTASCEAWPWTVACLEPGILREECRGHRIEHRHGQEAKHDGHQQRRGEELPG